MKLDKTLNTFFLFLGVLLFLSACPSRGVNGVGVPQGNVRLSVRVVDAVSSQPIPGARVSLKLDGSNVVPDVASDSNGQAVFDAVPAADGYKALAGGIAGYSPEASPSLKLVQDSDVVIPLQPSVTQGAGLVVGSVKDNLTKAPLANVSVTLSSGVVASQNFQRFGAPRGAVNPYLAQRRPFRVQQNAGLTLQTDASGQFTFKEVPPGSYQAIFSLNGYQEQVRQVQVTPGASASIETVFMSNGAGTPNQDPNARGHVLIVEAGRAFQIDQQGQTVWSYPSTGVSAAVRMADGNTLIADEASNRALIVGPNGSVLWDMGSSVGLFSRLSAPSWVSAARDGQSFLITDTGNNRVVEITGGQVSWEFKGLNRPRSASYSPTGNIVIADTGNRKVLEVDRTGQVVWSFEQDLLAPGHAVRLDDGSTLITDSGYNRIVSVNANGQPSLFYEGQGANALNRPRSTLPTSYGTFLISDTGNNRVIEVDRARQIKAQIPNLRLPVAIQRL